VLLTGKGVTVSHKEARLTSGSSWGKCGLSVVRVGRVVREKNTDKTEPSTVFVWGLVGVGDIGKFVNEVRITFIKANKSVKNWACKAWALKARIKSGMRFPK